MSGIGAQHVAEAVGNLNLAIASEQATILFRLAIQQDGVVGGGLIQ
jgi:hypothetical protein